VKEWLGLAPGRRMALASGLTEFVDRILHVLLLSIVAAGLAFNGA
jgi:hypothetical protein